MGHLDKAVPINNLPSSSLWIVYGKSTSGKTHFASTFPKPALYIRIGDDGSGTIANVDGIDAISCANPGELKEILLELYSSKKYVTAIVDTFSLFVNEWIDFNAVQKKKRVTQQMWGDVKTETEECTKLAHKLAKKMNVVLTCHEVSDSFEGMEDEIAPDIRPSVSKGARTYLEAMANYGIHMTVMEKQKEQPDGTTKTMYVHYAHLDSNPYYWVKLQKPSGIKVPKMMQNPSYDKIMKILRGE